MTKQVNMHEAKTQLSKLVEAACRGEEVIIAKAGKPMVKLTAVNENKPRVRRLGLFKGSSWMADDFTEPLSGEELALWEDGPIEPPS